MEILQRTNMLSGLASLGADVHEFLTLRMRQKEWFGGLSWASTLQSAF